MDEWTDLDQAYLDIFGNHPDDLHPPVRLPVGDYLRKLGEFAFWVSHLEWDIVSDIRVASAEVDVVSLLGRSTGQIGHSLRESAVRLRGRPHTQQFLATGARALLDVAERRNHVLHARPAPRPDGSVVLLRLRELRGEPQRIWVDEDFLGRQIKVVHYWTRRVAAARALPID